MVGDRLRGKLRLRRGGESRRGAARPRVSLSLACDDNRVRPRAQRAIRPGWLGDSQSHVFPVPGPPSRQCTAGSIVGFSQPSNRLNHFISYVGLFFVEEVDPGRKRLVSERLD